MRIEEAFVVDAPREEVWRHITDPRQVGLCLPGCKAIEVTGPALYKAAIEVGVGPIKTTFKVEVEVTEERFPEFVGSVTRGEEGGRASILTAHNELHLKTLDDGKTEVAYRSEVNIVGRLGKFGLGVMKKLAKSLGKQFADALCARIEAGVTES